MIIGLTGRNGAGKGSVAEYLQKKGFYYLSLSDILREDLEKQRKELTRDNLIELGNELRKKFGHGVLAKKTNAKLSFEKNYIIDSIRNPGEVNALKQNKNFFLIEVDAPADVRFERLKSRDRENDPKTKEEFDELEKKEEKNEDKSWQQLKETREMVNFTLANDSSIEELNKKIDKMLFELSKEVASDRPSWDDYFMNISKNVASRSNCMKRKVAAVIVKDKRIVATGYNGTPRGTTNCNEGGCPRCNSFTDSGTNLEECFCSHAEENAIVQSAYHGISIKGASIYSTFNPCLMCTKMIINSGIKEVVYNADYPLLDSVSKLFEEAGVKLRQHKIE